MSREARRIALAFVLSLSALGAAHAGPVRGATAAAPATLAEAERELAEIDRRVVDVDGRLGKLTADIAMRDRRSAARARAYARLARAGLLPVAGGFDALVAHAMKIESAKRALSSDMNTLRDLRYAHKDLVAGRDQLVSRRAIVAAQRDTLAQAQALVAEAEERKRAFELAFQGTATAAPGGGSGVAVYGAGITVHEAAPGPLGGGFAGLRGKLPFPVAGRAEVKAARRESANGPGVELRAPSGTAVRSVYPGRVAFSARYGDYGRIVIVDHGEHYYSVYGNLGTVDVKVGDEVSSSARLGTVGDEGAGSMLYFEIRKGSETLDPRPWLGV